MNFLVRGKEEGKRHQSSCITLNNLYMYKCFTFLSSGVALFQYTVLYSSPLSFLASVVLIPQRVLNDLQRARLSWGHIIRLLARPLLLLILSYLCHSPTPNTLLLLSLSYSGHSPTPDTLLLLSLSYSCHSPTPVPLLTLSLPYSCYSPNPVTLLLISLSTPFPLYPCHSSTPVTLLLSHSPSPLTP